MTVNRQLHNNTSGLSQAMREVASADVEIPEYFEMADVRKPAEQHVKEVLRSILDELFAARRGVEKNLSRRELLAYDKVLAKCLERDTLLGKLRRDLDMTFSTFEHVNQLTDQLQGNENNEKKQRMKERNAQPEFNRGIVDEDAFYKHLAYSGMLEKQRSADKQKTFADPQAYGGLDSFESWYQEELLRDARTPPRPINEADYLPKRLTVAQRHQAEKYPGIRQVRDQFLEDHKLYKENKLEQRERSELMFVLEKLRDQSNQELQKGGEGSLQEAQKHILDYFKNPANTQFNSSQ